MKKFDNHSIFKPERICSILEKIAKGFNPTSEEYFSVELAAKAILFIYTTEKTELFQVYLDTLNKELTPEQRSFLASIGLR